MRNLMSRFELEKFLDNEYPFDEQLLILECNKVPDIYIPCVDGYRCTGILDMFDDVGSRVEEAIIYAPINGGTRLYLL